MLDVEENLSFFVDGEEEDTWFPLQFYYRHEMLLAATKFENKMRLPWLGEQEPIRPDEVVPDDINKWDVNPCASLQSFSRCPLFVPH